MYTLIAHSSILKMKCISVNTTSIQSVCMHFGDSIWGTSIAMVNCVISQAPETVPRLKIFLVVKFRHMVNGYIRDIKQPFTDSLLGTFHILNLSNSHPNHENRYYYYPCVSCEHC